jgi:hypothetical protein
MKNYILFLLLILIVFPTVSVGAEMRNLEIDFSFNAPDDQGNKVLGYRLYKEGKKVCETNTPNVFKMNCALLLEEDTFDFTLAAYYSNGTESPQSAPFEFTIDPTQNNTPLPSFEMGEVSIDHEWVRVLFESTFNEPVVVAGPPTFNGSNPVLVRVRNIDQKGFEIRLQEWDYLDGIHNSETLSYIVMEKGSFTLDNGTKVEAGSFTGSNQFNKVSLQQSYNSAPVILTQVTTENENNAVTCRIQNVRQSSFEYKLQEQETTSTSHGAETIGYIAWELGKGELPGLKYEAGIVNANNNWSNLFFKTVFPDMPLFIAGIQTYNGGDTVAVRMQDMSKTAVKITIEEEQSKDSEVGHTSEGVGYFVIGSVTK